MELSPIIQQVIEVVILSLLPPLLALAGVWLRRQAQLLEARIGQENFRLAESIIRSLVQAAEQGGVIGAIEDKQTWVLERAEKALAEKGIVLDLDAISDLVEAAVWKEFGWEKREDQKELKG